MKHTLQSYAVETLNNAMKYKGLKQVDLAERLKFNRQRVHQYLTGKSEFTLNIYEDFCLALNIPVDKVFENYADLKEPQTILEDININYEAIKNGIIERYQADRKSLNALIEMLQKENQKLEHDIAERDIEIEQLKSKNN